MTRPKKQGIAAILILILCIVFIIIGIIMNPFNWWVWLTLFLSLYMIYLMISDVKDWE